MHEMPTATSVCTPPGGKIVSTGARPTCHLLGPLSLAGQKGSPDGQAGRCRPGGHPSWPRRRSPRGCGTESQCRTLAVGLGRQLRLECGRLLGATRPGVAVSWEGWMAPTSPRGSSGELTAVEGLLVEIQDLRAPTRRLLRVIGEIDLATVGLLRCAIHSAAADHNHVELDLSGVTFCDVMGATAIEQAQEQLQARGCQLTLGGIGGPFRRLLAVDGLFSTLQLSALVDGQQPPPTARG